MFQPVEVSDLYYNRKYKIVADDNYVGIYKGKFWHDDLYLEFSQIRNLTSEFPPPPYFLPTLKFYQFVSQKARIQSDMERRAVCKIVAGVLGDIYFKW
jgi:hypothetical protein